MKVSTITRSVFATVAMALAFATSLSAQRNFDMTIAAPANIAGTYVAVPFSSFGSADYCGGVNYSGELAIVNDGVSTPPAGTPTDGCEAITNDLTGKFALVDRGTCNFSLKALNAQNKGAIGVIICQNVADAPFAGAAGVDGPAVTVPVFMISKADCDLIRLEVPNGVTIDLSAVYPEIPTGIIPIWGDNPGEGDFDGSLNGWVSNNISCGNGATGFDLWQWADEGFISGGAWGTGTLASPTACNGGAGFYSDLYDNNGSQTGAGTGPCTTEQDGELVSPIIDLSGTSAAGVSLMFYQSYRHFTNSDYAVGFSTDGGSTWTEIPINQSAVVNTITYNEWVRIPLVDANGSSPVGSNNVRIKFHYFGNYYYWMIDDVMLIEQEANNIRVNSNFFAIPQNAMFPFGDNDPINFLADIENIGAEEQANVNLNMTITNEAGGVEFSADLPYGDLPGNTISENGVFTDQFDNKLPVGTYTGVYSVTQDQTDFDESDNTQTFTYQVTDNTYAKETGATRDISPAASNWETAGEKFSWEYGNCYYIEGEAGRTATSASFGLGNANLFADSAVIVKLYYWLDGNEDGIVQPDERGDIGEEIYTILGTETDDDLITVPFGVDGDIPSLEDDGYYILTLQYIASGQGAIAFRASDERDYTAMIFLTDSIGMPRFASMLAIDETLNDESFDTDFGSDIVPVVRLNASPLTVSTKDPLADANVIEVFPNPVANHINLRLDLVTPQEFIHVQVLDQFGRVAFENSYANIQRNTLNLNTSRLPAGTYSMRVLTNDGARTLKFVVSK